MAVRQPYRGNPEQKLYTLYNNFAGGMNTTDVDEAVYTHQLRLLENVELSEKGNIKNRNGFADAVVLNDLFLLSGIELPYNQVHLMTVLRDSSNVLGSINDYERITDFLESRINSFEITVLLVGTGLSTTVDVYTITFNRSLNTITHTKFTHELEETYNRNVRYTNIEHIHYGEAVYLMLGQLNNTVSGLMKIDYSKEPTFEIINSTHFYSPDAYEISNIGFNVLAADPLNAIASTDTSFKSIRTFWITEVLDKANSESPDNIKKPIYKLPQDEDFMINVLYTGNLLLEDITIDMYVEESDGTKRYLNPKGNDKVVWARQDEGIMRFRVKSTIDSGERIFIDINKTIPDNPEAERTFATAEDMVTYFRSRVKHSVYDAFAQTTTFYAPNTNVDLKYTYEIPMVKGFTRTHPKQFTPIPDYSNQYWQLWNNASESMKTVLPEGSSIGNAESYTVGHLIRVETGLDYPEYYMYQVTKKADLVVADTRAVNIVAEGATSTMYPNLSGQWRPVVSVQDENLVQVAKWIHIGTGEEYTIPFLERLTGFANTPKDTPAIGKLYAVEGVEEITYYQYNGGNAGTVADFSELATSEDYEIRELQFINSFDVGTEPDLKEVQGLELNEAKIIEMNGRLVIYNGNTIWFSDLYKFDYVPNVNYVVLPLNGDDEITKIAYFRGSYIVFTKETIYRMSGVFGTQDFTIVLINDSIGCIAPDSVRSVNNTLVFLSSIGLYTLKQNYYMEGLENVERVDSQVRRIVPSKSNVESVLYDNQVWMLVKDNLNNLTYTVKQYYDIQITKNVYATTVDRYAQQPESILKLGFDVYSYKEGKFYIYGKGYTDFAKPGMEEWEYRDCMYTMRLKTPEYNLGYPTHVKKIKNMFIKTYSTKNTKISVTVFVDGREIINPSNYSVRWNEYGELEYTEGSTHNLQTVHTALGVIGSPTEPLRNPEQDFLGYMWSPNYGDTESVEPVYDLTDFTLGEHALGVQNHQTHKLVVGGKGKAISFLIEQKTDTPFSIQDIGVLHKLGKVKEG